MIKWIKRRKWANQIIQEQSSSCSNGRYQSHNKRIKRWQLFINHEYKQVIKN